MITLVTLAAVALAVPPSTPPGLDRVCERYDAAEPTGPEVSAAALESGRRAVPCDIVAEGGVCLYGEALVSSAPGGSLATVPVARDVPLGPGETGTLFVSTLGHFVDDWQGETAYLKVDDHLVWTLSADQRQTHVVVDLTIEDDSTGAVRTYVGGELSAETRLDVRKVKSLNANSAIIRTIVGTGGLDDGDTTSTWRVAADLGDAGLLPLTTLSIQYTPNVTSFGSCWDGVQNGDEDGVDCGGSACTPCVSE